MKVSSSIVGACSVGALSFEFAFTSTAAAKAIARGGYEVTASQDCYVKLAPTSGLVAVVALADTQPTQASSVHTIKLFAGQSRPFDVPGDGMSVSVIRASADGTITFNGPFQAVDPRSRS